MGQSMTRANADCIFARLRANREASLDAAAACGRRPGAGHACRLRRGCRTSSRRHTYANILGRSNEPGLAGRPRGSWSSRRTARGATCPRLQRFPGRRGLATLCVGDFDNDQLSTVFRIPDRTEGVERDNFVWVEGTVSTVADMEAGCGETPQPEIEVSGLTVTDRLGVRPALRVEQVGQALERRGVRVVLERIEFAAEETRIYFALQNRREETLLAFATGLVIDIDGSEIPAIIPIGEGIPAPRGRVAPGSSEHGGFQFPPLAPDGPPITVRGVGREWRRPARKSASGRGWWTPPARYPLRIGRYFDPSHLETRKRNLPRHTATPAGRHPANRTLATSAADKSKPPAGLGRRGGWSVLNRGLSSPSRALRGPLPARERRRSAPRWSGSCLRSRRRSRGPSASPWPGQSHRPPPCR